MAGTSRRAWIASFIIVALILIWTEFVMVGALSLGVFPGAGIDGWWAPLATLVFALAAIWLLAWVFTVLGRIEGGRVRASGSRQKWLVRLTGAKA